MNRTIWFVAGAGVGAWGMLRARRMAEAFTPEGISDRFAGAKLGAQLFADEVRQGAAEKELELRERLELRPASTTALESAQQLPLEIEETH